MIGAYITAGVTVFIVIAMYGAALRRREYLYRLQQIGMTTVGTVIDIKIGKDSDGDAIYLPVIGYTTYDGIYRSYTMTTASGMEIGEVVPVTYDPARPEKPEIDALHPERLLIGVTIAAVVIIIIGVIITLIMLGIIPSSSDDSSGSAALLLPFPIIITAFSRMKRLVRHA